MNFSTISIARWYSIPFLIVREVQCSTYHDRTFHLFDQRSPLRSPPQEGNSPPHEGDSPDPFLSRDLHSAFLYEPPTKFSEIGYAYGVGTGRIPSSSTISTHMHEGGSSTNSLRQISSVDSCMSSFSHRTESSTSTSSHVRNSNCVFPLPEAEPVASHMNNDHADSDGAGFTFHQRSSDNGARPPCPPDPHQIPMPRLGKYQYIAREGGSSVTPNGNYEFEFNLNTDGKKKRD